MSSKMPEGWRSLAIGKFARALSERNNDRSSIPVLSVTKHRGFVRSSEYFIKSVHSQNTSQYKVVRKGQFAYATIHLDEGSIDFLRDHEVGLISPMYTVFQIDASEVDGEFLFRGLKRLALRGQFDAYSNGGVNRRKSISFKDLATYKYSLPPLPEQLAISNVLQSIKIATETAQNLSTNISASKREVMRGLLTVGIRGPSVQTQKLPERWVLGRVAEGVERIPSDWKLVRLTSVAQLKSGHTPDRKRPDYWDGDVPWISLGDTGELDRLTVEKTSECVTSLGIKNSSARVLPKDTVIFSRTATVGKATRLALPMATSQDFANWVCGPDISPRYLVQVFRHMKREWDRLQAGSTHQTIYMPTFKKLQILLPPRAEQEKIADMGEAFDLRIEAENHKLIELEATRAALAQELLSGRLRLPDAMVARFENAPIAVNA